MFSNVSAKFLVSGSVNPGLKENWRQFTLLIVVNAFVGGMVGLERSIFPTFAETEFGIASKTALLSFIATFGLTKAVANYFTGKLANRFGRKKLLLAGWLMAIPVPFMLIYAGSWNSVIAANMLLGISQGLTWSSTVLMKIDLVGPKNRGLAMGLNEFAGYLAVGVAAFLSGYIANRYGVTPYPFYLGVVMAVGGFLLSRFWVKDTMEFVNAETTDHPTGLVLENVFMLTTFRDKTLSAVTQAGLVNNLNDGMIWGLLPILLASLQFNISQVGLVAAIYPLVWGAGQLVTGKMSDVFSKKSLLVWGMLLQGVVIMLLPRTGDFFLIASLAGLLGLGTALVYPTFLSTIAEATNPSQRAESVGVFRLWRDMGYVFGAIISGIAADLVSVESAVLLVGAVTIVSAIVIRFRMPGNPGRPPVRQTQFSAIKAAKIENERP